MTRLLCVLSTGVLVAAAAVAIPLAVVSTPAAAAPAAAAPAAAAPAAAAPAAAALAKAASLPEATVTMDPLPTVQIDGVVWAQATVGNTVYAVGKFSSARPAGSPAGTNETPRGNILAYDIRTGILDTSFVHTLNAQALSVTPSPDGSRIYVSGQFSQVDGLNRYRIAAFSTATGALLPYAPSINSTVQTVAVTNDAVYFGGNFSSVNGNARGKLAATNTAGGLLAWNPTASGTVRGIVPAPAGAKIYVAGSFSTINGQATHGVSAVDPITGASIAVPVSSQIIASSNNNNGAGIYSLRTDGTLIYGGGYNAVSARFPQFEGTFGMDPSSGSVLWANDCWGDTYDAVPIDGSLYVASHAHNCSAAGYFPENSPAHYYGLAYGLSATTGYNVPDARGWNYSAFHTSALQQWFPTFARGTVAGQAVWAFTGNSSYVAAGGEFPKVNNVAQQGLVRFAKHDLAPNKYGPTQIGAATARQIGTSAAVSVTAQSAYDPDDAVLTYQLFRDGNTANPVDTTTAPTVGFWQIASRPTVTLVDSKAPAGSHSYTIRAIDGGGRAATSVAGSVAVTGGKVALGKPATQSSTLAGSLAGRAVDGNTDGNWSDGSVSITGNDPNSWWQVDLGQSTALTSINVYNRTDCCSDMLTDYWVFVAATPFDTSLSPSQQAAKAGVWSSHQTTQAATPTVVNAPVTGRYLMIQENTANQYLNLAEVQANGPPTAFVPNLALTRPATQSTTYQGYVASAANDGDTSTFNHTAGTNDWWQVDLGGSRALGSIALYNRADCCAERLTDYYVFVSGVPFDTTLTVSQQVARAGVWSSHQTTQAGFPTTIPAVVTGRYVMVQQNTAGQPLHLGEVQVFAR